MDGFQSVIPLYYRRLLPDGRGQGDSNIVPALEGLTVKGSIFVVVFCFIKLLSFTLKTGIMDSVVGVWL